MEVWKDVVGYEGIYEVSNKGRVRSIDRKIYRADRVWNLKGKTLKASANRDGYLLVKLCKNSKCVGFSVHRLVAESFIGLSELDVNHKDGNKENNNIENLEYVSRNKNLAHAVSMGLIKNNALINEKEIISDYLAGMGVVALKSKYKTHYSSLKKIFNKNNISIETSGDRFTKYKFDENEMLKLYAEKKRYAEIGRALGVSGDVIRGRMKKYLRDKNAP